MTKPWQIILVLVGIFAAGGVAGGFVTLRICKDRLANRPVPEEWAPRHLKRLHDRLELTPAQEDQIRPIVRHSIEHLNRIRNNSMEESKMVVETMQRDISEKLTPEQRAKFDQMNREMRELRDAREKAERAERAKRANPDRPDEGGRPPRERSPGEKPPPDKPPGN
jgi:Spy/CpxP family protein refolding chaperone